MQLVLGVIDAVATLISFLFILWQLSGSLSLGFLGIDANVPGYMVWVALVYAFVGTWLANMVGRRLIPLNFAQQALEADFRFSLVRVRENAEGIALYRGEPAEQENLVARYQAVFMNGWRVLYTSLQLAFYQTGYAQIAIIFPYLVTGPRFFAGAITLGVMTQTAQAFGQVQTALSFFIDNYATLAELRAVMDRLMGLRGAIDHQQDTAIDVAPEAGRADVGAEGLTLGLPDGQALLRDATLVLPHGHSTLITGASGSGKSTLFRALAGIWPFGHGKVRVPAGARVLFLPQKPYIPIGTCATPCAIPTRTRWRATPRSWPPSRPHGLAISPRVSTRWRTGPTPCRAASSSGSPWRAPWCSSPTGCSSTRPPHRSTSRWRLRSMAS